MAEDKNRRTKGDGMIRQRPDGTWEGRIDLGTNPITGKRNTKSVYAKSQKEVRNKMKLIGQDPAEIVTPNGVYAKVENSEVPDIPFGEWLDTWLTQYKAGRLTPSSYESYRIIIENHVKPAFGHIPISSITTDHIQRLINEKQEKGARKDGKNKKLAASSVVKIKIVINASLKQAVKNRLIPHNPTEAVTPPRMPRCEIRILTPEEQDSLMSVLGGHRLEALFKLALATGMRKGELLALTWDCVDFQNRTISISKSANRVRNQETMKTEITVGGPKSESGYRTITMLPAVVPILERHYELQQIEVEKAGSAYNKQRIVFCSNVGTYIEPRRINTTLEKLINAAGIEHINFHALRHTFASRALEAGIPAKVVQEMLGHADVAMTLNRYTHILKNTMHDEMQKMNAIFIDGAVKARVMNKEKYEPELVR